ncbi:MAG TPA: hypothetical protein VLI05_02240 [Candidatus Saccharimonadia bacterium]|nr:hypothetical protein [Candidatus Saccharimonadia bacterium]
MAELTAEIVREIVRNELTEVRSELNEMRSGLTEVRSGLTEVHSTISDLRTEVHQEIGALESRFDQKLDQGITLMIDTMNRLHNENRDELAGIRGRLTYHNERIARLEQLNHLR